MIGRNILAKWLAGLCLFALASVPVQAQTAAQLKQLMDNPSAKAAAVASGKKAAAFCVKCHGNDGNSELSEVPNLAGQNPTYLLNQVNKFYTGARKDAWMEPAIKLLSEAERLNIVAFFSSQTVKAAGTMKSNDAGAKLYKQVCTRCHGPQAMGDERIPRLAGQQLTYIIKALTNYRNRTGNRLEPEMLAMTAALKDSDIQAVAEYLSALQQ